jgi:hypothetical protein
MRDFDSVTVHDTIEGNPAWVFFDVRRTRDWQGYVDGHDVDFSSIYIQGSGWRFCTLMGDHEKACMALRYGRAAISRFMEMNNRRK